MCRPSPRFRFHVLAARSSRFGWVSHSRATVERCQVLVGGVRLGVLSCACVCRCRGCLLCWCVLCACDLVIVLHQGGRVAWRRCGWRVCISRGVHNPILLPRPFLTQTRPPYTLGLTLNPITLIVLHGDTSRGDRRHTDHRSNASLSFPLAKLSRPQRSVS